MGGGDYKEERERACVVSHCHSAGDFDDPYLYLVHNLTVGISSLFPVRSPPKSLASLLHSLPRLVLDCPATPCHPPQPGFSSLPAGIRGLQLSCPALSPTSIHIHIHTSISRSTSQSLLS